MKNIRSAEQEAHKEFSKLIHTSISDIYTDTCFHVSFIMKHRKELKKSKHRVKVIKSVQMELKRKHKEAWAKGSLKRLKKMHECFELLPASKQEIRWIYQQKQTPYADDSFESIFRQETQKSLVLLTGDYKLAEKISSLNSTSIVFFQYTTADTHTHVVLWKDYRALIKLQQTSVCKH